MLTWARLRSPRSLEKSLSLVAGIAAMLRYLDTEISDSLNLDEREMEVEDPETFAEKLPCFREIRLAPLKGALSCSW